MSDTTKHLVQIIHDMGVISERMDEKNKLIESQQATITELQAKVEKLTGLNNLLLEAETAQIDIFG